MSEADSGSVHDMVPEYGHAGAVTERKTDTGSGHVAVVVAAETDGETEYGQMADSELADLESAESADLVKQRMTVGAKK